MYNVSYSHPSRTISLAYEFALSLALHGLRLLKLDRYPSPPGRLEMLWQSFQIMLVVLLCPQAHEVVLPVRAVDKPSKWVHADQREPLLSGPPLRPFLSNTALPPAARTLCTHCTFSPSIDTRYRCPLTVPTTIGCEIIRPDFRPVTCSVAI